jgi:hypothetical protein
MAEYSRIARGSFTTSGAAQTIFLPFQPQRVELENVTAHSSPAQYSTVRAYWDFSMGQGVADQEYISAASFPWTIAADYVATGGISTFSAGLALQYGPSIQIASITAVTNPVVTTVGAHGLSSEDVVVMQGLYQTPTTGMPQMAGIPFVVTVLSPTTFQISWDASGGNYTALSASPAGAKVKKILNPGLYQPELSFISGINLGTTTTVFTANDHNFVVGQEIAFRIPSSWGTVQLNSLPNVQIPGSPIYGYVTQLLSNSSFICSINSTGFTAFTANQPVASVPGLSFPQVVAVGDVNTGGTPYSGGALYPSPKYPTFVNGTPTINGPAIQGSFVNNTRQGFIVGLGRGAAAAAQEVPANAPLLTASSLYVWTAYLYDYSV